MIKPIKKLFNNIPRFKLNAIIKILSYSDSLLWAGFTMFNVVAAVYLQDKLNKSPLETIAFGSAIYTVTRSIVQVPIARFLDNHKQFKDEVYAIAVGCFTMATSIFCYRFVSQPIHLYLAQFLFGCGAALNLPAWRKTFARFVDKDHEGLQYSIYDALMNLTTAILTSLGGIILSKTSNFLLLNSIASAVIALGGVSALFLIKQEDIQEI
jgi:MFS family permease